MSEEDMEVQLPQTRWAIDLDWFQQNNRSVTTMLRDYLCPKCAKKAGEKGKGSSQESLMKAVKDCFEHNPEMINSRLPILESVFRLFLVNGNEPLELGTLTAKLRELRGSDAYRISPEILSRLLKKDSYYGLREVASA